MKPVLISKAVAAHLEPQRLRDWLEDRVRHGDVTAPSRRIRSGQFVTAIEMLAAYDALGRPPTPEEVDLIDPIWWVKTCDGCGHEVDLLVQVGEEEDYESRTARLCASCLREALALLESA